MTPLFRRQVYALTTVLILAASLVEPSDASLGGHGIGPSASGGGAVAASTWEPSTWFLGTGSGGFYRLISGSPEWEYVGWILPDNGYLRDFATTPAAPGIVFALTASMYTGRNYVFRSIDAGLSWQIRGLGLPLEVNDIDCDPIDPSKAYAGTNLGLYHTTDAGFSWHQWRLTDERIEVVAVDPADPSRIWASAYHVGIYRTEDGGETWELHNTGMEPQPSFYLLVPGGSGGRIYSVGSGDYRSTDNGTTWSPIDCCPPDPTLCYLALSRDDPDDLIATTWSSGVVRSVDGGGTWSTILPPDSTDHVFFKFVTRDPQDARRAVVAMGNGAVVETADTGATWVDRSDGISSGSVLSIDVRGPRIIAGSEGGVFVSDDDGRHWIPSNLNLRYPYIPAVALSPDGTTALAGGMDPDLYGSGMVWRSADGGRTFSPVATTEKRINAVAADPDYPAIAYAASGDEWGGGVIIRSTDGGLSWSQVYYGNRPVWSLLVDPAMTEVVFAGTSSGILRSWDTGNTWSICGPGTNIVSLSPDGSNPSRFYAATESQGIWVSDDIGETWSMFGAGLPEQISSVDGRDPVAGVLVGTMRDQIWRNLGQGWEPLPPQDQPPTLWIWTLRATGDGRWLTGTYAAGIWEYRSDPAFAPEGTRFTLPALTVLGSPSRGPFHILPAPITSGSLRIGIYDPSGRLVRRHTSPVTEPWVWDGRDECGARVAAGIYLLRAWTSKGIEGTKICVLR